MNSRSLRRRFAVPLVAVATVALMALPSTVAANAGAPLLAKLSLTQSGAPVEVVADRLDFEYASRILTYEGNVEVRQGDVELKSDRLTISLEGEGDLRLRSVIASGNVRLRHGQRKASAGRAVFDQRKQTVELRENAVLEDGPNRVTGERIEVDLGRERSVIQGGTGRVRAVLYPPTPEADAAAEDGFGDE